MEHVDEEPDEPAEISPSGHPIADETTVSELVQGIDVEGQLPEEMHGKEHPTPSRPSGRLGP